MKFLTKDLYFKCYFGSTYNESEDKFLIGYLNNSLTGPTKLKDVVSGVIVEVTGYCDINELKSPNRGGEEMARLLMTNFWQEKVSIYQEILLNKIDNILYKEVVDLKEIAKIKKIMNKEIVKSYEKQVADKENAEETKKKYEVKDSQRDF